MVQKPKRFISFAAGKTLYAFPGKGFLTCISRRMEEDKPPSLRLQFQCERILFIGKILAIKKTHNFRFAKDNCIKVFSKIPVKYVYRGYEKVNDEATQINLRKVEKALKKLE